MSKAINDPYKQTATDGRSARDMLYADLPENSDELLRYELIVDRTSW